MYILHNQDGYFLTKSGGWSDGRELPPLFKTMHEDEGRYELLKINRKDYKCRLSLLECEINSKKMPLIPKENLPPVMQEPADANKNLEDDISENKPSYIIEKNKNVAT